MRYVLFIFFILVILLVSDVPLTTATKPYAYGNPSTRITTRDQSLTDPESLPLTILFAGDVMLARRTETLMDKYGGDFPYRRLPFLQELADNVVINFEAAVPIHHFHTPDLTFRFSVDQEYLGSLSQIGVTHASLANNHAYDTGLGGYTETRQSLMAAGITPFGASDVSSSSVTILKYANTSVALVAMNLIDEMLPEDTLIKVLEVASSTDYQIAFVHWGTEYRFTHNASQAAAAKLLVALGFDAIIGHHPHVVQDIDIIDEVPVFYSLGNFIFDQYFNKAVQEGLLVQLSATLEGLTFTLLPVTSNDARTQPRLLLDNERIDYLQRIAQLSALSIQESVAAGVITIPRVGCNSCEIN